MKKILAMHRLLNLAVLIVVFITFINALVYFGIGIWFSFKAYADVVMGRMDENPGLMMVEALDRFLIGFVFIIFSVGLSRLFLSETPFLKNYELPWLKITEFSQLKTLLISAILVALVVAWVPSSIHEFENPDKQWTFLLYPAALLLMAFTAKLIKDLH